MKKISDLNMCISLLFIGRCKMSYWECSKKPEECPYRVDYRGCIKENCKYPNEYKKKEIFYINEK